MDAYGAGRIRISWARQRTESVATHQARNIKDTTFWRANTATPVSEQTNRTGKSLQQILYDKCKVYWRSHDGLSYKTNSMYRLRAASYRARARFSRCCCCWTGWRLPESVRRSSDSSRSRIRAPSCAYCSKARTKAARHSSIGRGWFIKESAATRAVAAAQ